MEETNVISFYSGFLNSNINTNHSGLKTNDTIPNFGELFDDSSGNFDGFKFGEDPRNTTPYNPLNPWDTNPKYYDINPEYNSMNYSQTIMLTGGKNIKQLHELFVFFKKETNATNLIFDLEEQTIAFELDGTNFVLQYNKTNYTLKFKNMVIDEIEDIYFNEKKNALIVYGKHSSNFKIKTFAKKSK
jgi:hypothetical protein